MATNENLLADAVQLPIAVRLQLIEAFWVTVSENALPAPNPSTAATK